MPYLTTNDGVKLYYEDSGAGRPILFIHEFSGDYRAWELQVRYFARRYQLHYLQCARLSAVRSAGFGRQIFAAARGR